MEVLYSQMAGVYKYYIGGLAGISSLTAAAAATTIAALRQIHCGYL